MRKVGRHAIFSLIGWEICAFVQASHYGMESDARNLVLAVKRHAEALLASTGSIIASENSRGNLQKRRRKS